MEATPTVGVAVCITGELRTLLELPVVRTFRRRVSEPLVTGEAASNLMPGGRNSGALAMAGLDEGMLAGASPQRARWDGTVRIGVGGLKTEGAGRTGRVWALLFPA